MREVSGCATSSHRCIFEILWAETSSFLCKVLMGSSTPPPTKLARQGHVHFDVDSENYYDTLTFLQVSI
jgi:hypothetical protein